ncbi:MAG: glycosyltransferase family 4 protein [Parcubacteria group bacterium]|jgi:phosphatidylinositol alpha-1,6-mannosyltransferase
MKNPKILFISRAYPPVLGGIENQNYGIAQALTKITTTKIIANKRGKRFLPVFLPWLMFKGFFIVPRYDVVLVGDGVLTPICRLWKFFYNRKKYISIVHGLDITFAYKKSLFGKIYREVNIPALKKMDKLFMVGNESIEQAVKIGIPREQCVFIPNGLILERTHTDATKKDLEKVLGIDLEGKKVIFRAGRFTPHKGTEWFIKNIMSKLQENYILVCAGGMPNSAGDENYFPKCEKAVMDLGLEKRVKLLPNLPQSEMNIIFNTCDLSVSPNIKVPGSMEGFGITAIESAVCKRVILASGIEGLKDAIKDGENGFLLPWGDADAWVKKINEVLADDEFRKSFGEKARQYVLDNFTWDKISKKYLEEIEKTINA